MNESVSEQRIQREFAARMKQLRGPESLRQVARDVGICHNAIRQFELGVRMPSAFTLIKLADVFDMTVGELLGVE